MSTALMIGISATGFLLLYMFSLLDKEHWLFKFLILCFIPLIFIILGKVAIDISAGEAYENTAFLFYRFSLWFIRLFYTYISIYLIYSVFSAFSKNNKK